MGGGECQTERSNVWCEEEMDCFLNESRLNFINYDTRGFTALSAVMVIKVQHQSCHGI